MTRVGFFAYSHVPTLFQRRKFNGRNLFSEPRGMMVFSHKQLCGRKNMPGRGDIPFDSKQRVGYHPHLPEPA